MDEKQKKGLLTDEQRKELFKKKAYYRDHPEEAHREFIKRMQGEYETTCDDCDSTENKTHKTKD